MAKETMEKAPRAASARSEHPLAWPGRWTWRLPDRLDWTDQRGIRVEESREDGRVVVRAEVPGMDPGRDIDVEVLDGMLTIRGERRETSQQHDARRTRSEFRYGWFSRSFELPEGCAVEDIEAHARNGVLEVVIPVAEVTPSATPVAVPIQRD